LITFNKNTFFKNTYCEFQEVNNFDIEEKNCYRSKHNSLYFFTKEGVYRKSNHWGRVASCRWKLIPSSSYKNQQRVLAFAKWKDFYSLHETEKLFYISVNFETKKTKIKISKSKKSPNLLTLNKAQIKEKQIKHLETEMTSIQEKCTHKETRVKFKDGTNNMRVYCCECNREMGIPNNKEVDNFLNVKKI